MNGPNGKGKGKGRGDTHPNNAHERYRDLPDEEDRIGNEDPEEVRRWEMEEQQVGRMSHVALQREVVWRHNPSIFLIE